MNALRSLPKVKLQQIALVAILSLCGLVILGHFLIAKQWTALQTAKRDLATLKLQVEDAEKTARQADLNEELLQQMTAFVQTQQSSMITGDPFGWVVREISLLAEHHPVRLLSLRPAGTSQHPHKNRFEIFTTMLELEGFYDQLGNFVSDLENKFPTGQLRAIELVVADPGRGSLRATLQLSLLVRPETDAGQNPAKRKT